MKEWKRLPLVCATLVAINVIVFLCCQFTGVRLYELGELSLRKVVQDREYGRIIWAMFLHIGTMHIFNNMLVLYFLGAMIEKEIGHIRFGIVYFVSGIAGNLISLAHKYMTADPVPSVGASGAVFGLDGVILALVLFSGKMKNVSPRRVLLMIALSLYGGFTGTNIGNDAHIGGLLAGFFLGVLICIGDRVRNNKQYGGDNVEY